MSLKPNVLAKDLEKRYDKSNNYRTAVWFGFVLLFAAILRIYDLGKESYWVDEIYTLQVGLQGINQILTSHRLDQPPAYYLPFHYWLQIFGTAEIYARAFSVLASFGSIILLYFIGRELFSKEIGLLSALFMGVSNYQLFYAQEVRFYAFFEFTTLLSYLFLILALKYKKISYFISYVMASILMLYSHTYGVFILAAQNLFYFLQIKRYRNLILTWILCQAVVSFLFLPYAFPLIIGGGKEVNAFMLQIGEPNSLPHPSFLDPLRSIYRFILPARNDNSWVNISLYFAIGAAIFLAGTSLNAFNHRKEKWMISVKSFFTEFNEFPDLKIKIIFIGSWLLCPIVLPFIFSVLIAPIYADRYTICAAPAFYLLLALGTFSIRKITPLIISFAAFAMIIAPGLTNYYKVPNHQQWREAATFVQENSNPNSVIIFAGGMGTGIEQKAFTWYYRGNLKSCSIGNMPDSNAKSEALQKCISGYDRFWVIIRDSTEPSKIEDAYRYFFSSGELTTFHLLKMQQYYDVTIYLFERIK